MAAPRAAVACVTAQLLGDGLHAGLNGGGGDSAACYAIAVAQLLQALGSRLVNLHADGAQAQASDRAAQRSTRFVGSTHSVPPPSS